MIEISISKLNKNFGFKKIFDEFNLDISSGECIGLIGDNGCGKTTLFKMIMKKETLDSGSISIRKNSKIGYLSQIPFTNVKETTVRDYLRSQFSEILMLEEEMKNLEQQMANCNDAELPKILNRFGQIQQRFIDSDGYLIESKIDEICNKFNINADLLTHDISTLSGGEKTMINLAAIMLCNPDILILDEPTNNLDINTLEWLENYLSSYKGTIIMSSHDRYFLDKVATKIVLIERGKAEIFYGNYSYYLQENEQRVLSEFEQYKDQQKMIDAMKRKIKQLQEFGRLASPSGESFFKRAASIQKRLDKLELILKPEEKKELPLNFQMNSRSGKQVLIIDGLSLNVEDKTLLKDINTNIYYQDRVCLMGKNGTGKSTLIKYIIDKYNNIDFQDKILKIGSNVSIGYIPQTIDFEDDNETILEVARKYFNGTETDLRSALAKFMFNGDNVFKRVGDLSGGEKVRLKLFELMQTSINFLIMDEPTNHIDITTKEVLELALKEFPGTILFISHDRYFINELAKKILYIENKNIVEYLGNYDDYKNQMVKKLSFSSKNNNDSKARGRR